MTMTPKPPPPPYNPYSHPTGYPQQGVPFPAPMHYGPANRGPLALVLGIIGLSFSLFGWLACIILPYVLFVPALIGMILSLPAWIIGHKDMRGVDEGRLNPSGKGMCLAGMICGIIGTIMSILMLVVFLIMVIILMAFLGFAFGASGM